MESYVRRERSRIKERISARFQTASLIGLYMQKLFDDKDEIHIPHTWEVYPELFSGEQRAWEEQQKKEQLERARASRKEYAARYNEMRRQGLC